MCAIPATFVVPVRSQDMDFRRFCVQWVKLKWEVIVCFVYIGGSDEYNCLNF
jgi:hypothetical protein